MIAIPALYVRDGSCVQLSGSGYEAEPMRLGDPLGIARTWAQLGFRRLHVIDLDAATGRGSNADVVRDICADHWADVVQVGGGIRSGDDVERLLHEGADRVVLGTRAVEEPDWLAATARLFPGELIVAADLRGRRLVTRGWQHVTGRDVLDVVEELNDLPLGGLLVTAVHREGQPRDTDLFLMEDLAETSAFPVLASGGISTMSELRALADRGIAGAVVGTALYTGALEPHAVAEEFSE